MHVFFTGANPAIFMFNWEAQEWIILEDVPNDFDEGACGFT